MFLEILCKALTSPDGLCLTKPCKRSLSIHLPLGIFFRVSLAFFVSFQCWRAVLKSSGSPSRGLRRRSIASDHLLRSNATPGSVALTTSMVTVADPGEGPGGHSSPPPPPDSYFWTKVRPPYLWIRHWVRKWSKLLPKNRRTIDRNVMGNFKLGKWMRKMLFSQWHRRLGRKYLSTPKRRQTCKYIVGPSGY